MQDLSDPVVVRTGCVRGLGWGLEHARPGVEIDCHGNVGPFEENLHPDLLWVCWAGELGSWMDELLEEYMRSVRSSAALTVNCFGPLMMAKHGFSIGRHHDLHVKSFERRTRSGFEDAEEPHLDVIARGPSERVVIHPTCIDYRASKPLRVARQCEEPGTCFCPWSAWSCHIIRSEEAVSRSFERRLAGSDCRHCGFTHFTVPAVGLRASLPGLTRSLQALLLTPWRRPRSSSGSWCHRPTCGGG